MPEQLRPELADLRQRMKEFIDGEVFAAEPVLSGGDPLHAADSWYDGPSTPSSTPSSSGWMASASNARVFANNA